METCLYMIIINNMILIIIKITINLYLQFLFHLLVSFVQHGDRQGYQDKITQIYCFCQSKITKTYPGINQVRIFIEYLSKLIFM